MCTETIEQKETVMETKNNDKGYIDIVDRDGNFICRGPEELRGNNDFLVVYLESKKKFVVIDRKQTNRQASGITLLGLNAEGRQTRTLFLDQQSEDELTGSFNSQTGCGYIEKLWIVNTCSFPVWLKGPGHIAPVLVQQSVHPTTGPDKIKHGYQHSLWKLMREKQPNAKGLTFFIKASVVPQEWMTESGMNYEDLWEKKKARKDFAFDRPDIVIDNPFRQITLMPVEDRELISIFVSEKTIKEYYEKDKIFVIGEMATMLYKYTTEDDTTDKEEIERRNRTLHDMSIYDAITEGLGVEQSYQGIKGHMYLSIVVTDKDKVIDEYGYYHKHEDTISKVFSSETADTYTDEDKIIIRSSEPLENSERLTTIYGEVIYQAMYAGESVVRLKKGETVRLPLFRNDKYSRVVISKDIKQLSLTKEKEKGEKLAAIELKYIDRIRETNEQCAMLEKQLKEVKIRHAHEIEVLKSEKEKIELKYKASLEEYTDRQQSIYMPLAKYRVEQDLMDKKIKLSALEIENAKLKNESNVAAATASRQKEEIGRTTAVVKAASVILPIAAGAAAWAYRTNTTSSLSGIILNAMSGLFEALREKLKEASSNENVITRCVSYCVEKVKAGYEWVKDKVSRAWNWVCSWFD